MADNLNQGDYVLATKWSDGDPADPWAVGFLSETIEERYIVVDSQGKSFRSEGFRRARKISAERGKWIFDHQEEIEMSGKSLWGWLRAPMR